MRTREGSVATASQWKTSENSAASTKNSLAGVVPRINSRPSKVRRSNRGHGLVGQNAVRSAAIGDDLLGAIELGEPRFKLAQRNVHRAGQMSERKFIRRADIEDADHACARFFQKLLARDGLHAVAVIEIAADHALHFGEVSLRDQA